MTLPVSPNPISLNAVNIELSIESGSMISMGETAVRGLFAKASGAISLSDGYGKSAALTAPGSFMITPAETSITFEWQAINGVTYKYTFDGTAGSLTTGTLAKTVTANTKHTLVLWATKAGMKDSTKVTLTDNWSLPAAPSPTITVTQSSVDVSWTTVANLTYSLELDSTGYTAAKTIYGQLPGSTHTVKLTASNASGAGAAYSNTSVKTADAYVVDINGGQTGLADAKSEVWYKYIPAETFTHKITATENTANTLDTKLSLYASSDLVNHLVYHDDIAAGTNLNSRISYTLLRDTTYYFKIGTFKGSGYFTLGFDDFVTKPSVSSNTTAYTATWGFTAPGTGYVTQISSDRVSISDIAGNLASYTATGLSMASPYTRHFRYKEIATGYYTRWVAKDATTLTIPKVTFSTATVAANSITWNWSAVTGMSFQTSTDDSTWSATTTSTSASRVSLEQSTPYSLYVRLVNSSNEVGASDYQSNTTLVAAPTVTTSVTALSITLSWGTPLTNWIPQWSYNQTDITTLAAADSSVKITSNIAEKTKYTIYVRYKNGTTYTGWTTVTPTTAALPVITLTAATAYNDSITLNWTAITGCTYQFSADNSTWTAAFNSNTVNKGSLYQNQDYTFYVRAVNAASETGPSVSQKNTTTYTMPTITTVSKLSKALNFSWTNVANNVMQVSNTNSNFVDLGATDTAYKRVCGAASTPYDTYFRLRNATTNNVTTATKVTESTAAAPAAPVFGATVTAANDSLTFTWTVVTGNSYKVSIDAGTTWVTPGSGTYTWSSLNQNQSYTLQLKSINDTTNEKSAAASKSGVTTFTLPTITATLYAKSIVYTFTNVPTGNVVQYSADDSAGSYGNTDGNTVTRSPLQPTTSYSSYFKLYNSGSGNVTSTKVTKTDKTTALPANIIFGRSTFTASAISFTWKAVTGASKYLYTTDGYTWSETTELYADIAYTAGTGKTLYVKASNAAGEESAASVYNTVTIPSTALSFSQTGLASPPTHVGYYLRATATTATKLEEFIKIRVTSAANYALILTPQIPDSATTGFYYNRLTLFNADGTIVSGTDIEAGGADNALVPSVALAANTDYYVRVSGYLSATTGVTYGNSTLLVIDAINADSMTKVGKLAAEVTVPVNGAVVIQYRGAAALSNRTITVNSSKGAKTDTYMMVLDSTATVIKSNDDITVSTNLLSKVTSVTLSKYPAKEYYIVVYSYDPAKTFPINVTIA